MNILCRHRLNEAIASMSNEDRFRKYCRLFPIAKVLCGIDMAAAVAWTAFGQPGYRAKSFMIHTKLQPHRQLVSHAAVPRCAECVLKCLGSGRLYSGYCRIGEADKLEGNGFASDSHAKKVRLRLSTLTHSR